MHIMLGILVVILAVTDVVGSRLDRRKHPDISFDTDKNLVTPSQAMELIYQFEGQETRELLASGRAAEVLGGKGKSLSEMLLIKSRTGNRLNLKPGYTLAAQAFTRFVAQTSEYLQGKTLPASKEARAAAFTNERARVQGLLGSDDASFAALAAAIQASLPRDGDSEDKTYFAVRSSATAEDSAASSFSGKFHTELFVSAEHVVANVLKVWASVFDELVYSYCEEQNVDFRKLRMAVVVMAMVGGPNELDHQASAGTAFTRSMLSGREQTVVSATYGSGEGLVDGSCSADDFLIDANTLSTIAQVVSDKPRAKYGTREGIVMRPVPDYMRTQSALTPEQARSLAAQVETLKRAYRSGERESGSPKFLVPFDTMTIDAPNNAPDFSRHSVVRALKHKQTEWDEEDRLFSCEVTGTHNNMFRYRCFDHVGQRYLPERSATSLLKLRNAIHSLAGDSAEIFLDNTSVDIEFAVDVAGQVWVLQSRPETVVGGEKKDNVVMQVDERKARALAATSKRDGRLLADGMPVSSGVRAGVLRWVELSDNASGKEVMVDNMGKQIDEIDFFAREDVVLFTHATTSQWEDVMRRSAAVITRVGSSNCHTAIACREMSKKRKDDARASAAWERAVAENSIHQFEMPGVVEARSVEETRIDGETFILKTGAEVPDLRQFDGERVTVCGSTGRVYLGDLTKPMLESVMEGRRVVVEQGTNLLKPFQLTTKYDGLEFENGADFTARFAQAAKLAGNQDIEKLSATTVAEYAHVGQPDSTELETEDSELGLIDFSIVSFERHMRNAAVVCRSRASDFLHQPTPEDIINAARDEAAEARDPTVFIGKPTTKSSMLIATLDSEALVKMDHILKSMLPATDAESLLPAYDERKHVVVHDNVVLQSMWRAHAWRRAVRRLSVDDHSKLVQMRTQAAASLKKVSEQLVPTAEKLEAWFDAYRTAIAFDNIAFAVGESHRGLLSTMLKRKNVREPERTAVLRAEVDRLGGFLLNEVDERAAELQKRLAASDMAAARALVEELKRLYASKPEQVQDELENALLAEVKSVDAAFHINVMDLATSYRVDQAGFGLPYAERWFRLGMFPWLRILIVAGKLDASAAEENDLMRANGYAEDVLSTQRAQTTFFPEGEGENEPERKVVTLVAASKRLHMNGHQVKAFGSWRLLFALRDVAGIVYGERYAENVFEKTPQELLADMQRNEQQFEPSVLEKKLPFQQNQSDLQSTHSAAFREAVEDYKLAHLDSTMDSAKKRVRILQFLKETLPTASDLKKAGYTQVTLNVEMRVDEAKLDKLTRWMRESEVAARAGDFPMQYVRDSLDANPHTLALRLHDGVLTNMTTVADLSQDTGLKKLQLPSRSEYTIGKATAYSDPWKWGNSAYVAGTLTSAEHFDRIHRLEEIVDANAVTASALGAQTAIRFSTLTTKQKLCALNVACGAFSLKWKPAAAMESGARFRVHKSAVAEGYEVGSARTLPRFTYKLNSNTPPMPLESAVSPAQVVRELSKELSLDRLVEAQIFTDKQTIEVEHDQGPRLVDQLLQGYDGSVPKCQAIAVMAGQAINERMWAIAVENGLVDSAWASSTKDKTHFENQAEKQLMKFLQPATAWESVLGAVLGVSTENKHEYAVKAECAHIEQQKNRRACELDVLVRGLTDAWQMQRWLAKQKGETPDASGATTKRLLRADSSVFPLEQITLTQNDGLNIPQQHLLVVTPSKVTDRPYVATNRRVNLAKGVLSLDEILRDNDFGALNTQHLIFASLAYNQASSSQSMLHYHVIPLQSDSGVLFTPQADEIKNNENALLAFALEVGDEVLRAFGVRASANFDPATGSSYDLRDGEHSALQFRFPMPHKVCDLKVLFTRLEGVLQHWETRTGGDMTWILRIDGLNTALLTAHVRPGISQYYEETIRDLAHPHDPKFPQNAALFPKIGFQETMGRKYMGHLTQALLDEAVALVQSKDPVITQFVVDLLSKQLYGLRHFYGTVLNDKGVSLSAEGELTQMQKVFYEFSDLENFGEVQRFLKKGSSAEDMEYVKRVVKVARRLEIFQTDVNINYTTHLFEPPAADLKQLAGIIAEERPRTRR